MTLKWKVIIGVAILLAAMFAVAYGVNRWNKKEVDRSKAEMEAARSEVRSLTNQQTTKEEGWKNRERELLGRLSTLNNRIAQREKEINGLNGEIQKLEKERAAMLAPQSPDAVCPELVGLGYSSCTRATRRPATR